VAELSRGRRTAEHDSEAIRYRALRGKWPRRRGNDGKARIQLPEHPNPVRTPSAQAVRTPSAPSANGVLIKALEAHVETLKAQLAAAEARIDKQADDLVAYDTAYAAGLAAERAKAERLIAEFAARDAQHDTELAAERARTSEAIAAFANLAERLDALAAERSRPWWRRLVG
jgi:hypothetical protein